LHSSHRNKRQKQKLVITGYGVQLTQTNRTDK
jgi:hypothetical protein